MEYTCSKCGESYTEAIPKKDKLHVLFIGNSHSDDCAWLMWDILKEAGIEDVKLGIAYIGGCTIEQHYGNAARNKAEYEYRINETGEWITEAHMTLDDIVKAQDWDTICFQQATKYLADESSYEYLDNLVEHVKGIATNKEARLCWHMNWSYPSYCTRDAFAAYNYDHYTHYSKAIENVKNIIEKKDYFSGVIYNGTVVYNLRTVMNDEAVYRDDVHLSWDYGRYAVAMNCCYVLAGVDIDSINCVSEEYMEPNLALLKEAVNNAIKNPYSATRGTIKFVD